MQSWKGVFDVAKRSWSWSRENCTPEFVVTPAESGLFAKVVIFRQDSHLVL